MFGALKYTAKMLGLRKPRDAVDPQFTRPQGFHDPNDLDLNKLRRLIKRGKLAPCYPGRDAADDGETEARPLDADAAKGACVAPVCGALCASCVSSLGPDQKDAPSLDALRGACGDEHACLCAQCLEENMLAASEGARGDASQGRFGFNPYVYGGLSYSQSLYAPGYGGYGPNNPYRPGGVPGNTPYGPYPGSYYPGYAVYSPPWFVSVYSKSNALVVSSLCYWWPWYPACRPPPPRRVPTD